MANKTISQLDVAVSVDVDAQFVASVDGQTKRVPMSTFLEEVKTFLGYLEKPLIKCRHCGQWGAVYCACAHCGAPIDPPS